jgi:hypothetical protein
MVEALHMGSSSFHNIPAEGLQSSADAAEGRAVERFLRWREFARAVQVAVRRGELSARLDIALRRGAR